MEYEFVGFEAPLVGGGVRNVAKAGQTVPLRWRLTDAAGNPVTNLSSVQVSFQAELCGGGTPEDPVGGESPGASGLQNLGNGRYQFNWATPKSYANSCKTLTLTLGDGIGLAPQALFKFTR